MDQENRTGFWKSFLLVLIVSAVISGLGIWGLHSLFEAIDLRPAGQPTAPSFAEVLKPTAEPTTAVPIVERETIDRNESAFLDRMGEIEKLFTENQVLDYDLDEMHAAACRAYAEAAGEDWEKYENASPQYGEGVTVIPRQGSDFLNRLGEVAEMVELALYPEAVDTAACEDAAFRAFVEASGDRYSAYLTEKEWDDMLESSSGSYCGIGVQISQDRETMESKVVTVFSSSPALEAGMKVGDIFKAVDGMDITEMILDEIVTYVRGEEGTTVTITVYRPATGETLDLTCERRQVQVDTVYYEMLTETIGYIQLTEFDEVSVQQVRRALADLQIQGMQKLVFDLRGNPGGLLTSVLNISDYFLDKGRLIFRMDYVDGEIYQEYSQTRASFEGDMILLVDGNSASASEVMTGIMQDYGRATVMGTQTYGKGIVQSFFTLTDGGALKTTIAHYFSPLGRDFHGVGITPDIVAEDDETTDEDELLELAIDRLR